MLFANKLYTQSRRHSVHFDDILTKHFETKAIRSSKLNKYLTIQNIILNRIGMFKENKQYSVEEINSFERKRRSSWDQAKQGIELLSLEIRALIHEHDLAYAKKVAPPTISK